MDMGGAENFIMNVFRNIDREEFAFDFVVHSKEKGWFDEEIRGLGGKIFYIPKLSLTNYFSYKKRWNELLHKEEYGVVHGHMQSTASIYSKIAHENGARTIIHSHTSDYGEGIKAVLKRILQRDISKHADVRLACSDKAGKWLFRNNSFQIIKNGIDAAKFLYDRGIAIRIRQELGFGENDYIIGHVGRFDANKNQRFAIEIYREFKKIVPASKLLLVGDGETRSRLLQEVKATREGEGIVFAGIKKNINEIYMAMDFFVFPSFYEGLPLTLIEAQASGLKSLVSDAVSSESKITDLLKFASINRTAKEWAVSIDTGRGEREKYNPIVGNSEYGIFGVVEKLSGIYRKYA